MSDNQSNEEQKKLISSLTADISLDHELEERLRKNNKHLLLDENKYVISYDKQLPHIVLYQNKDEKYTDHLQEAFQKIRNDIYPLILEERKHYDKIFNVIESYVKNNDLFVSNIYKISKLDAMTEELYDYHYNIYCERPLDHANNIINEIFEKNKDDPVIKFLNLKTILRNEEFMIEFDARIIAKIFTIQKYNKDRKNIRVYKAIEPHIINDINYLPPEIEIIDVYQKLYNGELKYLQFEEILFNEIQKSYINNNIKGKAEGSAKKGKAEGSEKYKKPYIKKNELIHFDKENHMDKSCYEKKKDILEALKIMIVKDFLADRKDIMLLGPIAYNWYSHGKDFCPSFDRIQITSTLKPTKVRYEINKFLSSIDKNYTLSYGEELELIIPKDFRTKRLVFSINIVTEHGIKTKPFLEYFNTAQFDVIPGMIKDKVLIGQKHVLLRFLFIDLWVTKFVHIAGKIDNESYQKRLSHMWNIISNIHVIPNHVDGFLGIYQDFEVAKKILSLGGSTMFFPYYPFKHFELHGELRNISKDKKVNEA